MNQQPGIFITVEGIEGVGKSTCIHFIKHFLDEKNIQHCLTREPGGTEIAEAVRGVLLNDYQETMCSDTELLLMFAGRAQHIEQVIRPALAKGEWVVSDRFTDATYAYQGGGRSVPFERIAELETWVQGDLRPDLCIILDAPLDIALERARQRSPSPDRFEKENHDFFNRVRNAYLKLAESNKKRYRVVDASGDENSVKKQLIQIFETLSNHHQHG